MEKVMEKLTRKGAAFFPGKVTPFLHLFPSKTMKFSKKVTRKGAAFSQKRCTFSCQLFFTFSPSKTMEISKKVTRKGAAFFKKAAAFPCQLFWLRLFTFLSRGGLSTAAYIYIIYIYIVVCAKQYVLVP